MFSKISDHLNGLATKRFTAILAVMCAAYYAMSYFYLKTMPLIMDEFSGALAVYQFSAGIPYVDFTPYKTIIGYYIQLPALMLPGDIWSKLIYVKAEMVLLNGAAIFTAAQMLTRHFKRPAILAATLLFLTMSNFLEHGEALRVDMLTAWFGLFSLLFLMRGRMIVSGLLLATSFLTSQKGIYYTAATIAAMGLSQLVRQERPRFRDWLVLGAAAAAPVCLYGLSLVLFGARAEEIARQVVVAHKDVALDDLYRKETMSGYWTQTLSRNPAFYALLALGILTGLVRAFRKDRPRVFAICSVYGAVLLAGCAWHKQSWPYFFLILIPTGWLLVASFFDGVLDLPARARPLKALLLLCGIAGAAYPLQRVPVVLARGNDMQKGTVALADHLVEKDEFYLAGIGMLFDRKQPPGLSWLDWKAIAIRNRDWKTTLEIIQKTPPKLYIDNYRIRALKVPVRRYLAANYAQLKGNVYLYCPTVTTAEFRVSFDGEYTVRGLSSSSASATLDGEPTANGRKISLKKAISHRTDATGYRLCLSPRDGWREVVAKGYKKTDEFMKPYDY